MNDRKGLNVEASTTQVRADAETARTTVETHGDVTYTVTPMDDGLVSYKPKAAERQFDPAMFTPSQLDGIACVKCFAESDAMVPVGIVNGAQVFACLGCAEMDGEQETPTEPTIPPAWEEQARKAGQQAAFRVRASYDATQRAYEQERASKTPAYWLASHPCPDWCTNGGIHRSSDHPDDRVHDSDVHSVSLHTMEPATFFAEFTAPELTMMLTQRYREGEPRVFINDSGDDTRLYATLAEAEELANALLTLVAQARGQTDSST